MNKNQEIAKAVLENVGGKDNITKCFHCITRLRLEVKDRSLMDQKAIEAINGVIALKIQGEQYQVVIGQNVGEVYREFCKLAGLEQEAAIDENLDEKKEKITLKGIGNGIMKAVVNSIIPALPILIGAGMVKTIALLLTQFGIVSDTNSTYLVLYNIGECGFYFLPVYISINAAKHFKTSQALSVMTCAFLLLPAFSNGLADGTISNVFGVPITSTTYSSTVLPPILIVWVLSYVNRFFEKYIPKVMKAVLVPTLTLLIMIPLAICVLGPLGAILGVYIANFLVAFCDALGFVGVAIMAALHPLLVFTGMHTALTPFSLQFLTETGHMPPFSLVGTGYVFGSAASCLAVSLKAKSLDIRSSAMSCATTAFIGGITEPALYGVLFRFKRPLIAVMIGNAVAGAYLGITNTYRYQFPGSNGIFGIPSLVGPTEANLINALIAIVISMIIAFVLTWILGFKEEKEA